MDRRLLNLLNKFVVVDTLFDYVGLDLLYGFGFLLVNILFVYRLWLWLVMHDLHQLLWNVLLFFCVHSYRSNRFALLFDYFLCCCLGFLLWCFNGLNWRSFRRLPRLLALLDVLRVFCSGSEWRFMQLESLLGPSHRAGGRKRRSFRLRGRGHEASSFFR